MCSIDSIYDNGYFTLVTGIVSTLLFMCYLYITKEEVMKITGNKY